MPICDNNIPVATASDTETTGEASSGRRRGRKLKKTETRPRQQWDRIMERTLVKIITTEKEKGKGFMARTKEKWDNKMPEYRFFNMKNLRDKYAKLPANKVEELLQEEEDDVEIDLETEANIEMGTEEETDGHEEQTEDLMEESEYDVEVTEENLSEYERKLLKKTEEMLRVEIGERKIKRIKLTPKKEILEKINTAAIRVWTILKRRNDDQEDTWMINCLVYTIHSLNMEEQKDSSQSKEDNREDNKTKEIKALRRWISWVDNEIKWKSEKKVPTKKQQNNSRRLMKKYGRKTVNGWKKHKLKLKERLCILVTRRKRQKKQKKRQRENALYQQGCKDWFKDVDEGRDTQGENINDEDLERILDYWKHMWSDEEWETRDNWNEWADQIREEVGEGNRAENVNEHCGINMTDLKNVLKKMPPMKAAGPDGIPPYWWKKVKSLLPAILRIVIKEIREDTNQNWLYEGRTWLFTKRGKDVKDECGKRPITCLNTFYKIASAIVARKLCTHVKRMDLYPVEQRGGINGNMGCKEQLIVDETIHEEVKHHKRNLSEAWIDLRKAYDSVYKKWLTEGLKLLGVPKWIVEFVEKASNKWSTRLLIQANKKIHKTEKVKIERGIFQGDSLSPLLFCICIIPVTIILRKMKLGYMFGSQRRRSLQKMITHLLFMDDMKFYATLPSNLKTMLNKTTNMLRTIGLELGQDKCAIQHFKRGKKVEESEHMLLDVGMIIEYLGAGANYPYLGFIQEASIEHNQIKEKLKGEFKKICKIVWKSELNARNKSKAYNELAVAKLIYSFGVIKWTRQELEELDTTGRKIMHMAQCLHPRAAIERLYLSRDQGGRGLLNIVEMHDRISVGMATYISTSDSKFMKSVKEHEINKWAGTRMKDAVTILNRYGFDATVTDDGCLTINNEVMKSKKASKVIKKKARDNRMETLNGKSLHGQLWKNIEDQNAAKESWLWLKDGRIASNTEATLMAIQDGVMWTRNYQKAIGLQDVVDKCRLCGEPKENIAHLIASCKGLLGSVIKQRHDDCARSIYIKACWGLGLLKEQHRWWERQAVQCVLENEEWMILWDHTFSTDRSLEHTRPDLVFENKRTMEGTIVEIGICLDQNLKKKLEEKRTKYVKLAMELSKLRGWQKWKIVPIVAGATGILGKSLEDELRKIPGIQEQSSRHLLLEMQKIIIYSAVNIMRHVLNSE